MQWLYFKDFFCSMPSLPDVSVLPVLHAMQKLISSFLFFFFLQGVGVIAWRVLKGMHKAVFRPSESPPTLFLPTPDSSHRCLLVSFFFLLFGN